MIRHKAIAVNGLLFLLSMVVCAVMLEVLVRLWSHFSPPQTLVHPRPTFFYAQSGGLSPTEYDYSREKPEGVFRIVVVGDSFTFPTGMQLDDSFSKRLERMLNLNIPRDASRVAEVINFGKMGLSTVAEVARCEKSLEFHPDVAMLEITLNDIIQKNFHQDKNKGVDTWLDGFIDFSAEQSPILSRSKLLSMLGARINSGLSLRRLIAYHQKHYDDPSAWGAFQEGIRQIKRKYADKGVRFVAVVFPYFYTASDQNYPFAHFHEKIENVLSAEGIEFLDLRSAYNGIRPELIQIMPGADTHPNEIAHRIAADNIYAWFEEKSIIPGSLCIAHKYRKQGNKAKLMKDRGLSLLRRAG